MFHFQKLQSELETPSLSITNPKIFEFSLLLSMQHGFQMP